MELLYVYIDKYRCFKEQEIIFSNKFNVEFNKSNMTLKISKNDDYINIYPNNIVGINAIVGKNSSGKTCLLDLLGERIYSRNRNDEIWTPEDNDPHENPRHRFLNPKIPKKPEVASSYFFIYYFGQDSEHNSLFVFEATNYIKDCKVLFENNEMKINTGIEEYFDGKGWASFVFLIDKDERFIYKGATNAYKLNNGVSIQDNSSIILFKHDFRNVFGYKEAMAENESKICIQRRNRGYKNILKYDQINFLIEQMNSKDTELYKNEEYYLTVEFDYNEFTENKDLIDFQKVVYPYKELNLSNMNDYEKSTLNFIYGFTCKLFNDFMLKWKDEEPDEIINLKKDIQDIEKELIDVRNKYSFEDSFEKIKGYYYETIDIIFRKYNDRLKNDIDKFRKNVDSFYGFLKDCYKNKIEFEAIKDGGKIKFKKESVISNCRDFFDNCIDEVEKKHLNEEYSLMAGYISTEIDYLSDGELANLELYSSIYEQINYLTDNKKTKNFILLFDEIEREMHPEMCRELIFSLIVFLNQFEENNFQLILSTHSPFLVSDLRKENLICLRKTEQGDREVFNAKENTFAQNIHLILKNDFFLNSTIGAYSKKCINVIANLLTKEVEKEKNLVKYENNLAEYEKNLAKYEKNFWQKLNDFLGRKEISDIEEAEKYLRTMISSIGENIIKNELLELLDRCKIFDKKYKDIDSQIKEHKKKIEELELVKRKKVEQYVENSK